MQVQTWRDYAELVALVAVVGSLVAVVLELRQTQAAIQAQTYQERAFQAITFNLELAGSAELGRGDIVFSDLDPDALSAEDYNKALRVFLAIRIDLDNEHYRYQNGFLEEDFYLGSTMHEIKAFAPKWRNLGISEARSDFRTEVDRILADDSVPAFTGGKRTSSDSERFGRDKQ